MPDRIPTLKDEGRRAKETSQTLAAGELPFLDLRAQFATIRDEVMDAVTRVMESQQFILGDEVQALETEVAAHVGAQFGVGCASGSDALFLALLALKIGTGDEVITTPFTFVATAGAIVRTGAKPVFVDIDAETFNMDPRKIERAISERTRGIMPVHLFGLAADMNPILELAAKHNLPVIEDAAQAIGARYGEKSASSLGVMGCLSFFPSKNLGGAGDGGMVVTNDASLTEYLRLARAHGARKKYFSEVHGINSRLDALQAAILRVKLKYLASWAKNRQRNADRYRALFQEAELQNDITSPLPPAGRNHVYNQFTVRAKRRNALQQFLRARGIPTEIYYPVPLHLQPAFTYLGYKGGDFPVAEAVAADVLSLPIYPELSEDRQAQVVRAISDFYQLPD